MSLIDPSNIFAIWLGLLSIVAFALWIEGRPGPLRSFGPISLIVIGLIASNVGILPKAAPSYDVVTGFFVPLSIPLLLFGANLVEIWREARRLLVVFLIGALGTTLGAILAMTLLPFGQYTGAFGGMFAATYIGGSVNFAAVSQMLEIDSTSMMAPALAANSIAATFYLTFLVAIPAIGWFVRFLAADDKIDPGREPAPEHPASQPNAGEDGPMTGLSVAFALALSAAINVASIYLADVMGVGYAALLFATAITVALATLWPRLRSLVSGHYKLGSLLIYVFFVLIGVTSDLATLFEGGARLTLFAAIILAVHFAVIMAGARVFGFTLGETVTASNACALGPASAAALAATRGWHALTTPAVLLGVFGYFIANFVGVTIGKAW